MMRTCFLLCFTILENFERNFFEMMLYFKNIE